MADQEDIKIYVKINSQYRIFDLSGSLLFSIVFGLCRCSTQDTDPRSLIIDTSDSVFDVPYALANGLLQLFEVDGTKHTIVDLSSFSHQPGPPTHVALPPSVQRSPRVLSEDFTVFLVEIEYQGSLARLLKPNTDYAIQVATADLGVKRWNYADNETKALSLITENSGGPSLVNSKPSAGKAAFKTRSSLQCPPTLKCHLALSTSSTEDNHTESKTKVEVSVENTNERPVSIQSSGHQQYLEAWGPFHPVPGIDHRPRISSTRPTAVRPSGKDLCVISSVSEDTRTVVARYKPPTSSGLYSGAPPDRRPTRADFTTLVPGEPFVKTFDLNELLLGVLKLPDGEYVIELDSMGAWWSWEGLEDLFESVSEEIRRGETDDKISKEMYSRNRPPIWLRSEEEVAVRIVNGEVLAE